MTRTLLLFITAALLMTASSVSQVLTGRIVDETATPVPGALLKLYVTPNEYDGSSDPGGHFIFNLALTGADDPKLPSGYVVTNNFPNPFNPKTRIGIMMPARGKVRVEVFDMLGESVAPAIEKNFEAGNNFIDVDLNGLANGVYVSRITIDDKIVTTRKMMLLYGSQHLKEGAVMPLKKGDAAQSITIDSLNVITSYASKTFRNLPRIEGDSLDLGDLVVERVACPTSIVYEGKTYQTILIGDQCWFKENLNVGTMVPGAQTMNDNGVIERYCYDDDTMKCLSYGALYQWNEAMQYSTQPGAQGICPQGWHMPSREDYEILLETAGLDGNALKKEGQGSGNGAGTNTSGFSAILAGRRYSIGDFGSYGHIGVFWTSTEYSGFYGIYMHLYNSGKIAGLPDLSKKYGFSVRCLKD